MLQLASHIDEPEREDSLHEHDAPADDRVLAVSGNDPLALSFMRDLLSSAGIYVGNSRTSLRGSESVFVSNASLARLHAEISQLSVAATGRAVPAEVPSALMELWEEARLTQPKSCPWGWVESFSPPHLEMWRKLAPKALTVLIYSDPWSVVLKHRSLDARSADRALTRWLADTESMLRFHAQNPGRTMLLQAEILVSAQSSVLSELGSRIAAPVDPLPRPLPAPLGLQIPDVPEHRVRLLLRARRDVRSRLDELHAKSSCHTASAPALELRPEDLCSLLNDVWEATGADTHHVQWHRERSRLADELEDVRERVTALTTQVGHLETEQAERQRDIAEAERNLLEKEKELEQRAAAAARAQREVERLSEGLQQLERHLCERGKEKVALAEQVRQLSDQRNLLQSRLAAVEQDLRESQKLNQHLGEQLTELERSSLVRLQTTAADIKKRFLAFNG
ncbi:MAG: hypothetical protein KDD44_06955 [Bdellovibrionales bacterium]|nr:hypothetical protein [Bdellovibrionales bacterium]